MIKKISIENLRLGMYIHDLNCSWVKHKFFFSHFKLRRAHDLEKLQRHPSREVFIDTSKGLDVMDPSETIPLSSGPSLSFPNKSSSRGEELPIARSIRIEATEVITSVLRDVRLGRQVKVERIEPVVGKITDSILRNQGALVSLCRLKQEDKYTFQHCVSVAALLVTFCRYLGMDRDQLVEAGIGGMLHDVGKMHIPNSILNKPSKLESDEFEIMKTHVNHGCDIMKTVPGNTVRMAQIVLEHHERFDGTGYPNGISGQSISQLGRMASIVDVYDAITSDRVYQKGTEPATALRVIYGMRGRHFDPHLVQQLIEAIGVYPIGSVVLLNSGRLAVVIDHGVAGPSFPMVRVVFDINKSKSIAHADIDLSYPDVPNDFIVEEVVPANWKINPQKIMGAEA